MKYNRKVLYETKFGRYLSLILPFAFMFNFGCGGPADEVNFRGDYNEDGKEDLVQAKGIFLLSKYPITAFLSGPGESISQKKLGMFRGRPESVRAEKTNGEINFEITTSEKVYKVSVPNPYVE